MDIGPILRAMFRNKIGAVLIALQIAFTMTVVVNAYFMIAERVEAMDRPSGLAESELFHIASSGFADDFNVRVTVEEDLALLRQTPGIVDAVQVNAIPLSGSGWSMGLQTEPGEDIDGSGVAVYMVDDHGINTFGVNLIAGENFEDTDVQWRTRSQSTWPPTIIITEAMAKALFPDDSVDEVVGKTVYIGNTQPMTIIGVVERMQAPWNNWDTVEQSMFVPQKMEFESTRYLVRTEPGRTDALMPVVEELLANSNEGRLVRNNFSMEDTRRRSYQLDSGLATILAITMVVLVVITSFGIVGLASFSVRRRTKQIGTRRALGATKADIVKYFLVENFLITTMGVVLGGIMTIVFNMWLVDALNFPKIDLRFVPVGMLVLWVIGQLAVMGPARRASSIPPAVATRTV